MDVGRTRPYMFEPDSDPEAETGPNIEPQVHRLDQNLSDWYVFFCLLYLLQE